MESRNKPLKLPFPSIGKKESPRSSPIAEGLADKKAPRLYPIWKHSSIGLTLKPEVKPQAAAFPTAKPVKPNKTALLPSISKGRPFSEDNVTHQPEDFHSASKELLMASISHNRELRRKFNPIQSQGEGLEGLRDFKEIGKSESHNRLGALELIPITEKKGYVEKIRKGMINAKKFDNPALYLKEGGTGAGKLEGEVSMEEEEEIKDEMNVTINSSEKSLGKNNAEIKRISEKNSKSSSYEDKRPFFPGKRSNLNSSSNSEDLLKKKTENIDASSESFNSEIYGKVIKWKMGDLIDCGSFSQVFRAMDCETGKIFAVKKFSLTVPLLEEASQREIEAELEILQRLDHQNIVKYYGNERIGSEFFIYLEYISGGNIPQIIAKYGPLAEDTIKTYAKQLISGLEYLHSSNVIHKDIKGANILIHNDGTLKLSDFGCSKIIEKTLTLYLKENKPNAIQGSIPWMAPEVIKQTKYGRKSDVWSFGCTILEMVTGKPPWFGYSFDNAVAAIMKIGLSDEIPAVPETLSANLRSFIEDCLQRDPEKRPSVRTLQGHRFLKA